MSGVAPYGAWPSPVSAQEVAAGEVGLGDVAFGADGAAWWAEMRPAEGGRYVLVRDGEDMLPDPWNARTAVHEYGGRSWVLVPSPAGDVVVFAHWDDQRLYRLDPGADAPVPLTDRPPEPRAWRYAQPVVAPGGDAVWCVTERHEGGRVRRAVVEVPLTGGPVRELVTGHDFFSDPQPSPDGRQLLWLAWDHPRMPWDGTELYVAALEGDGAVGEPRRLLGGPDVSVFQPTWAADGTVVAVSDHSGWWNLYALSPEGGEPRPLAPAAEEFGLPQWVFGTQTYAHLADGRIAVWHGRGEWRLDVLDPRDTSWQHLGLPYTAPRGTLAVHGSRVLTVAGGPTEPRSVLRIDVDGGAAEVVRRSLTHLPDPDLLPAPRAETFPGPGGRDVHAIVYPPHHPEWEAPDGELPPYVVFVHGGPTAHVNAQLDMEKVFFTSRGIGVIDVNYGGSTGYGRAYRQRLNGQWGVVDVADSVAAAQALADQGRADRSRLAIRGGSAGGWTTLAALTRTDAFAAGTSYFGVAELLRFVVDTHDFESRYIDSMVGPLPEARALYEERAPLNHVDELSCPVLLLQGLEDKVVPPSQAEMFRDALVRKGIPHAYLAFAGEQHGFRRAETVVAALEAELSFYGQVLGFTPPGVPRLPLSTG